MAYNAMRPLLTANIVHAEAHADAAVQDIVSQARVTPPLRMRVVLQGSQLAFPVSKQRSSQPPTHTSICENEVTCTMMGLYSCGGWHCCAREASKSEVKRGCEAAGPCACARVVCR